MELIPDLPEHEYHAGPGLSSTGAKLMVKCPAMYRHAADNPERKDAYDFGTIAHTLVLGKGARFEVVDGNRNATAVKERIAEVRAEGRVPIKSEDLARAQAAADAVLTNPDAGALFASGVAEQSWRGIDPATGVRLRARFDWLTEDDDGPLCVDLKTTSGDVHPWALSKTLHDFGYHQQAAWYLDALDQAGIQARFRFVFVSTRAPHEIRVVTLPSTAIELGRDLNARAIEYFQQCTARDEWPCLHPTTAVIDLPPYAYKDAS